VNLRKLWSISSWAL